MQSQHIPQTRVRRTVNDLVMAELFLVQATIESATAIGSGINELSKQIGRRDDTEASSLAALLQRVADDAVEPYASRYQYFRELISLDH